MEMIHSASVADKLPRITAPTLVIGGDRDPFYSEALMRETAQRIPNAEVHLLPGGHSAMKKESRAFEAAVLRFLTT